SLIDKKELWGLIACHNYTQKSIDYNCRKSAQMIGQILSSGLEFRKNDEDNKVNRSHSKDLEKLAKQLMQQETVVQALTENKVTLLNIVNASGSILVFDQQEVHLGITPNERQFKQLRNWIITKNFKQMFRTDALSSVFPPALEYKDFASGMIVCALDREWNEFAVWFKAEKAHSVHWAGNPQKSLAENADGVLQISPRNSFKTWKETVLGKSQEWTAHEISSIKHLKEEIIYTLGLKARGVQELNQRLKVAYDELDTFSYTISHDLKNPLAVIRMYAQVLKRDSTSPQDRENISSKIIKVSDKMNDMIAEVLNYSKVGRHEIKFQLVDVEKMVRSIISDMRLIHYDKILNITLGNMASLYGEELMINQVFTNLIGNAIKYSKKDMPVEIHIEAKDMGDSICYSINDKGIGISTHNLLRVFDLFERVDIQNKNVEGSGVGLAIVKRIMSRHHGKIWVESILGEGSTFFILFAYPSPANLNNRNKSGDIVCQ
ncbi:MAG: histidine kinase, partial [Pedobacter sp.]